jgi:exosortase
LLISAFQFFSVSAFPEVPSTLNHQLSTTPQPTAVLRPPFSGLLQQWLPLAAFAVLWLDLIRLLSSNWQAREQYAYGWFVPILALGLFIKKWPGRPLTIDHGPQTTDSQVSTLNSQPPQVSSPVVSSLVVLCAALLLPLRVIYEINRDWPLISWVYTAIVVALTLYAINLAGPPSSVLCPPSSGLVVRSQWSLLSPWVRHFAFPVCFILVAVVWPYRLEKGLTQGLMRLDANITVEILGWLNIPAMQRGNLIELATGTVGVDEACSGIRSFQSTLMAALFLGELYLLRRRTRLLLVVVGLMLAFGFNVIRTLILAWQANAHGLSAIDKWHDPAGFTIAIACFFCLWAVAVLIKRRITGLPDYGTTGLQDHRTTGPQDHRPRTLSPPPPL